MRQVPGFRSGTRWKQVVAVLGYSGIGLLTLSGMGRGSGVLVAFGLWLLGLVLLSTNAFGIRSRVPGLNSPSRLVSVSSMLGLVLVTFLTLVALTPTQPRPTPPPQATPTAIPPASNPTGEVQPPAVQSTRTASAAAPSATATSVQPTATRTLPSPTPEPPTPTPRPPTATPVVATATPLPEPVTVQGRGQTATEPLKPPASVNLVRLVHEGRRNFIVTVYQGEDRNLMVNTIGGYRGTRPLFTTQEVTFDIEADGTWSVQIEPVESAGTPPFAGRGDDVSKLFMPPAAGAWEFTHDGKRNFVVTLWCQGGRQLVQNRIGQFQGSGIVRFPKGPCLWEVVADGSWSLTLERREYGTMDRLKCSSAPILMAPDSWLPRVVRLN